MKWGCEFGASVRWMGSNCASCRLGRTTNQNTKCSRKDECDWTAVSINCQLTVMTSTINIHSPNQRGIKQLYPCSPKRMCKEKKM